MVAAVGLVSLMVAGVALPGGAEEQDSDPSAQATVATLQGGGLGTGSDWFLVDTGAGCVDNSATANFALDSAHLDPGGTVQTDAYDGVFLGYLDGTRFDGNSAFSTDDATFAEAGPVSVGGLAITQRFDTFASESVIRVLVTFHNPGVTPVNATWTQSFDLGSDSSTTLLATGSGDTTLSLDDSYTVTHDGGVNDPVNTLVYFGTGDVLHPAAFNPGTANTCENTFSGTDKMAHDWQLSVPAGGTVSLLFFGVISDRADPPAAVAAAPGFPAIDRTSPLLAGLSSDTLAGIVNWDFPAPAAPLVARFTG